MVPALLLVCWLFGLALIPAVGLCEGTGQGQQIQTLEQARQVIQQLLQRIEQLERQQAELRQQLEELRQQVGAPAAPAAPAGVEQPSLEELLSPEVPAESESVRSAVTRGNQAFNPDIAVVGDFLANFGDTSPWLGLRRHNTWNRHIELAFSQRVSPEAKAVVKFAYGTHGHWHADEGRYEVHEHLELEEGYVQIDKLWDRVLVRLGRERLPFMRYNLLDGHELPFCTRPISVARFFGDHGLIDDGLRVAYLLPTSQYLSLEAGIYNCRNSVAFSGLQTNKRMLMARLHGYTAWDEGDREVDWNFGYLHGPNPAGHTTDIWTLDATYQRFFTQFDRRIASAGLLFGRVGTDAGRDNRLGWYLHVAKRWDRYRMNELGLLVEGADSAAPDVTDRWHMASLYYTWHRTHRLRFRAQYSHLWPEEGPDDDMFFFQTTYVMGTHPPHD